MQRVIVLLGLLLIVLALFAPGLASPARGAPAAAGADAADADAAGAAGPARPAAPVQKPPPPGGEPGLGSGSATAGAPPVDGPPPAPAAPQVILYDQYNNAGTGDVPSQNFEDALNNLDAVAADDFVIPNGQTWTIETVRVDGAYTTGAADSVNVFFYVNAYGLPWTQVAARLNLPYAPGPGSGDFVITLSPPVVLNADTYWIGVQANQNMSTSGQWFWHARHAMSNVAAAWRNPGGGWGRGCQTWGTRWTTCGLAANDPDQVYRLDGTLITHTPTPTPIPPTATATPGCVPGPGPWAPRDPLANARGFAGGAVVGGEFYVLTGYNATTYVGPTERYDPATNTWTTRAVIPTPHSQARAAAVGSAIYLVGGWNMTSSGVLASLQIYNTVANTWSLGANLPAGRAGPAVATFNNRVYIFGGNAPPWSPTNTTWEYDPVANTYTVKAPMPMAQGSLVAATVGNRIYVLGGETSFLNYAYDPAADSWSTIAPGPVTSYESPGVFVLGGEVVLFGSAAPPNQVLVYNPTSNTWRQGPPFLQPRVEGPAGGAVGAVGFAAGGFSSGMLNSVEATTLTACVTPSPTPTNTTPATMTETPVSTATGTPGPTATGTPGPLPTATATPMWATQTATTVPPTPSATARPAYQLYLPAIAFNR